MSWAFFKTFGPYIIIVALVMVVLFYRGDMIKANAAKDQAVAEATQLRQINKENAETLKRLADAKADNDRIVKELAEDVAAIRARGNTARITIQEAKRNDPAIRSWADTPVPGRVRDALERPQGR